MTDLFAQQGINFQHAEMASTHPTATPEPIEAPKVDMANAPANATPAAPAQNSGNTSQPAAAPDDRDYLTQLTTPPPSSESLAGAGSEGVAAAGAAPPQPQANSTDLFQQQGIKVPAPNEAIQTPSITQSNQDALTAGIPLSEADKPYSVDNLPPAEQPANSVPSKGGMSQVDFGARQAAGDTDAVRAAKFANDTRNSNIDLARKLYGDEQVNQWLNNPIGAAEGMERMVAQNKTLPFAGGATDATQAYVLNTIAQKNANKEPLTAGEQQTVDAYMHQQLEEGVRGYTRGGKVATSLVVLPAWLMEYAAGEGAAKMALSGVKIASPALSGLAQVATTSAFMPTQYVAGYAERQLNASTAITDKGMLVAKQSTESPAMSFFMSYGFVNADVASAMAGPGINKYVVEPATKLLSTPIVSAASKLPIEIQDKLYAAYKAVDPNATFSKLMTPAGYNSALSAVGSFQLDRILRSSVQYAGTPDMKFSDYMKSIPLNEDDLLVAGALTAIHGGISSGGSIMKTILQTKGVDPATAWETISQHSALEQEDFVNKNLPLPQSATPTSDTHLQQFRQVREQQIQEARTNRAASAQDLQAGKNYMRSGGKEPLPLPVNPLLFSGHETGDQELSIHADAQVDAARNIISGGTQEANTANPALIHDDNSGFNKSFKGAKAYAEMWNDLQPIENLGKLAKERGAPITATELSPAALSLAKSTPALIERQWTTGTTSWDKEGNQVETGKGLKQIGDDFDNMMYKPEPDRDARQKDMNDFRKAMTFIEDKTKGYNPVSDKDFNESQANLSRLADKYGDQMQWFETFAKEYRDFDNRILHNLVTSGLKTQAWYDDLVGKREWYSSTARVIEAEYPDDVAAMKGKGIGADVNPNNIGALKQRKGSDLEVQDPVISSMRNSAIVIRRAMLNKVRVDTAKYAEYYPEKVKVKPPAIIREAVDHSYDPKLRTKLEQLVDFLGGQVKRVQQGDKVGSEKNNLGAYEPATKSIYMRQGSTEGTLTHEAGHMLDYMLGLKERLLGDKEMKAELQKLSEDRLRSDIKLEQTPEGKTEFAEKFERNPKKYVEYVKSDREVLANFFDAWVNSPEQAKDKAPKATAAFEKLIDENPQLSLLRELAPSTQRATEVIQKELLDFKGPKDSLPFYQNGRLMFLHMDEDTARAFKGLDQVQSTMVGGFIAKVGKAQAKLLQFGATNNPYFIVRHFLRGAQSSYVNTPEGGTAGFFRHFALEIPKGIAAVIGKNDAYREWASSSGALRTYMDTSSEGMAKLHAEMFDHGDMSKFLNPLNWAAIAKDGLVRGWQTAKQVSDYAPRIAAYERLKDKGYSDLEAGFLSLEATGNYIRHGSLGKEINAYSPFFNDRLQGADRFLRAVKRDPAGYSMRAMALITMPQLLISGYYLFAADDQTRKEYLNLNDFRRSAAMNVKINGQWIPLPRAFAPGFVFGALPEFAMIHFSGIAHPELKNFWLHMIGDTVNSLSPSTDWTQTIPPLIKSAIEAKANFSFYRNMPLFHGDVNKTAPENQFNSSTSESAKAMGKLFGISPVDIDNTSYDMAAHIGVYAQQLGDYAINTQRRLSGQPVNERPTKGSDNPLYGPLMQPAPVGTSSESFQEFNEHAHDLAQQHNRDKEATGKDKADFERDNHEDLALYPTINRANTEVVHEEHEIRLITENPHLSGDDKAQAIAQHQQKIQIIVEGANNVYRNVKGQK